MRQANIPTGSRDDIWANLVKEFCPPKRVARSKADYLNKPTPPQQVKEHLQDLPLDLLKRWRAFQQGYFSNTDRGGELNALREFCLKLLAHRANPNDTTRKLIEQVHQQVDYAQQLKTWNELTEQGQKEIIDQEKFNYGSVDFHTGNIPRVVREQIRDNYEAAVQEAFAGSGFRLIGLGYGGAAFLVEESLNSSYNIPPYVLKVPVSRQDLTKDKRHLLLKDEYSELKKLEDCVGAKKTTRDHLSQALAYYIDQDGAKQYLGREEDGIRVLATVYQPGDNIYETARQGICRLSRPETASAAYVVPGPTQEAITELILSYLWRAVQKINFTKLFPHNMLFNPETRTFGSIGAHVASKRGSVEELITNIRYKYPLDTCILDLISFMVLHEQNHPVTNIVREHEKQTLLHQAKGSGSDHNNIFCRYRRQRFQQIYKSLVELVKERTIRLQGLQDGLARLVQAQANEGQCREIYGDEHYVFFQQLFGRLTKDGRTMIELLKEHFEGLPKGQPNDK